MVRGSLSLRVGLREELEETTDSGRLERVLRRSSFEELSLLPVILLHIVALSRTTDFVSGKMYTQVAQKLDRRGMLVGYWSEETRHSSGHYYITRWQYEGM